LQALYAAGFVLFIRGDNESIEFSLLMQAWNVEEGEQCAIIIKRIVDWGPREAPAGMG
jgi:hypothetical protein